MIRQIGQWFSSVFKTGYDTKIILLGMDAAGKTTMLYKLKLGDSITNVIPTIGFTLETVEYKRITLHCWDVGGCDKIRPLWRHYTDGLDALVYVVDSNDRYLIEQSAEELKVFISEFGPSIPVLLFANKRDLPDCMSIEEFRDKMGITALGLKGEGLVEGFDWLHHIIIKRKGQKNALENLTNNEKKENNSTPSTSNSNYISNSNSISNSNPNSNSTSNTNNSKPSGPPIPQPPFRSPSDSLTNNEFLSGFESQSLPSWDHKTHIRIAYLNLKRYGRGEGVRKIRQGLQDFIAKGEITNKNRYHETMTYFWIQMTHNAMSNSDVSLTWEPYDDVNGLPEFDAFLEKNAHLMNGELMLNNMESRQNFVAPDIKPLPNLVPQ